MDNIETSIYHNIVQKTSDENAISALVSRNDRTRKVTPALIDDKNFLVNAGTTVKSRGDLHREVFWVILCSIHSKGCELRYGLAAAGSYRISISTELTALRPSRYAKKQNKNNIIQKVLLSFKLCVSC